MLKNNYSKNKITKILSKKLYINLLNVKDILEAVNLIINKKINPGNYVLKNKYNFSLQKIVSKKWLREFLIFWFLGFLALKIGQILGFLPKIGQKKPEMTNQMKNHYDLAIAYFSLLRYLPVGITHYILLKITSLHNI